LLISIRNNTELNFVCFYPDTESEDAIEGQATIQHVRGPFTEIVSNIGWNIVGSQESLLRVFDEFSPAMKTLLAMADPDDIKLWRLLDRKALGTWINGKSCLIGDAAHPFLPR